MYSRYVSCPSPRTRKRYSMISQSNEAIFFREIHRKRLFVNVDFPPGNSDLQQNFLKKEHFASSYPWSANHLQGHRVAFNFPDVAIDLVGGETYILALLLVRHVRQDQSLTCSAFQWHSAVREYLRPSIHARPHREICRLKAV